jgi:DNA-binding transcriptional LysR family regulator
MESWDDLRLLLAVHRAGTLSAAAPLLGVDQSTVSRRLGALARVLGAPPLERREGRYVPTPAGMAALQRAERVEREFEGLRQQLDGLDQRPGGAVRLTVPDGLGTSLVVPRLWEFQREHPGVDLVVAAEPAVVNLVQREADVAVRLVRPTQHQLLVRRLARIAFAPYASESYLSRRPRSGGVLSDEDLVLHETSGPELDWLLSHAPRGRVRVRVRSALSMQAAVIGGAGVGMLISHLGAHPSLRPLLAQPPVTRDAFLVLPRSLARVPRVRAVCDFVTRCVAQR